MRFLYDEVANEISGAGSDYMSYTQLGYPAAFASEGNPSVGDYDPYIHTEKDTMHVDDDAGVFSLEVSAPCLLSRINLLILSQHMARFSELAIAFVIEQAGWDNKWR